MTPNDDEKDINFSVEVRSWEHINELKTQAEEIKELITTSENKDQVNKLLHLNKIVTEYTHEHLDYVYRYRLKERIYRDLQKFGIKSLIVMTIVLFVFLLIMFGLSKR